MKLTKIWAQCFAMVALIPIYFFLIFLLQSHAQGGKSIVDIGRVFANDADKDGQKDDITIGPVQIDSEFVKKNPGPYLLYAQTRDSAGYWVGGEILFTLDDIDEGVYLYLYNTSPVHGGCHEVQIQASLTASNGTTIELGEIGKLSVCGKEDFQQVPFAEINNAGMNILLTNIDRDSKQDDIYYGGVELLAETAGVYTLTGKIIDSSNNRIVAQTSTNISLTANTPLETQLCFINILPAKGCKSYQFLLSLYFKPYLLDQKYGVDTNFINVCAKQDIVPKQQDTQPDALNVNLGELKMLDFNCTGSRDDPTIGPILISFDTQSYHAQSYYIEGRLNQADGSEIAYASTIVNNTAVQSGNVYLTFIDPQLKTGCKNYTANVTISIDRDATVSQLISGKLCNIGLHKDKGSPGKFGTVSPLN